MRVFVLSAGRCGTLAWAKACGHITNYSSAHESRARHWPDNHIEIDNRLAWFPGRIPYDAFVVRLVRADLDAQIRSHNERRGRSRCLVDAYDSLWPVSGTERERAQRMIRDVYWNIQRLEPKMTCTIENWCADFPRFWRAIGAKGNLKTALGEFERGWHVTNRAL